LCKFGCEEDELSDLVGNGMLFKFPRTHHLFDAGGSGVSRDDLVMDSKDCEDYFGDSAKVVLVQEKVDGANLGISLTKDYEIICQNRSHYVTSESASQWTRLSDWIETHRMDLCRILEPERHILFGEWCYAKHSLHYTELPDYFLAFDIYDRFTGNFLSFKEMQKVLDQCDVPIFSVPIITTKKFLSRESVAALLDTKSAFRDDVVEGIYLRIETEDVLIKRCKLVRPDFVQGITEHWTKKVLVKNKILFA
jgi:atypical dual specificity phosphatase